jgi:hypothetical protein
VCQCLQKLLYRSRGASTSANPLSPHINSLPSGREIPAGLRCPPVLLSSSLSNETLLRASESPPHDLSHFSYCPAFFGYPIILAAYYLILFSFNCPFCPFCLIFWVEPQSSLIPIDFPPSLVINDASNDLIAWYISQLELTTDVSALLGSQLL